MNKLISIVAAVLIAGCQSQEEKKQSVIVEKCETQLKSTLKDPDSVKFVSKDFYILSALPVVTIIYNAKNSYGGYVGNDMFVCNFDLDGNITKSF
jgi:hypothetical protein